MSVSGNPTKEQLEHLALQGLCYADDHLSDQFSIREVSEMLGMSYSYFYHNFVSIMGEPFWHYVKRHRLEMGAGLLRHSGYGVGEISEKCGYATIAAFSKAFKQHFRESPKDFRRIVELPTEKRTLQITESITNAIGGKHILSSIFSHERTEKVTLPDTILYYSIISRGNNPIGEMVARMTHYYGMLNKMLELFDIPDSRIITGTLDAVPVTHYERLAMYAGISIPASATTVHQQLNDNFSYLLKKRIPGGNYLRLPLSMGFAAAGIPMYHFINQSCKEGVFKMSGNHFFISLIGHHSCEIYIPLLKKTY